MACIYLYSLYMPMCALYIAFILQICMFIFCCIYFATISSSMWVLSQMLQHLDACSGNLF